MATSAPSPLERLFLRSATVLSIVRHEEHFLLLDIQGQSLMSAQWTPGQKVQFFIGTFTTRTYTPISWNSTTGVAQFLIYLHGNGLACEWAKGLKQGGGVHFLGPRKSVALNQIDGPAVFVGDETSIALALSSRALNRTQAPLFIFESRDRDSMERTLSHWGLHANVVQRLPDYHHLSDIGLLVKDYAQPLANPKFVLTGRAKSIQFLSQSLKKQGVASSRIQAQAYWAEGKKGLD